MNNIYKYYKTDKLLCKNTNNTQDYFDRFPSKSILEKYRTGINKFVTNNIKNYNPNYDKTIIEIDDLFNNYLINENTRDIDKFCKKIIEKKMSLSSKQNIKSNLKKLLKIDKNKTNLTITNPLFKSSLVNKLRINSSNEFINNKKQNYIQLDIISQGKFINLTYPTLGIIKNDLTLGNSNFNAVNKYASLLDLFNNLLFNIHHNFNGNSSYFKLPIQHLDIGKTVCDILTANNSEKISSIREFVNTNDINMENIMTYVNTSRNRKIKLLKTKYIIPYQFNEKNEDIELFNNKLIKRYEKNIEQYLNIEKILFDKAYENIQNSRNVDKVFLNKCYKVMYLFSYRNIILFYDIYSNFINGKLNKHIVDLKLSNNPMYKILNYKDLFEYVNKLNESLLSVKTILLNNLYNIFKPNIKGNNYGIVYLDKDNLRTTAIIDEKVKFYGNDIFKKLFFDDLLKGNTIENYKLFTEFPTNDSYDSNYKLFIGVSYNYNKSINSSLGILDSNFTVSKSYKKVDLKIINSIIKILKNCIPIELLSNIISKKDYFKNSNLNDKSKTAIKNYIVNSFESNLKKSLKFLTIIKKSNPLTQKILILKSKIYYNISYFIFYITERSMYDISLKNEIIKDINKIKENYLISIKNKFK